MTKQTIFTSIVYLDVISKKTGNITDRLQIDRIYKKRAEILQDDKYLRDSIRWIIGKLETMDIRIMGIRLLKALGKENYMETIGLTQEVIISEFPYTKLV